MKENWVGAAMTDDNLVAELLLSLHRPESPLPPLHWGIRQPRSKAAAENESSCRRSPTTPLSWTDSLEKPSPPLVLAATFKGSAATDTSNSTSASKRSRRKRTFAQLKEDESSLIKEREHLNKQIESLHTKLVEQKLLNESLKRIKIHLHAHSAALNEQVVLSSNKGEPEREASTSGGPSNVSKTIKSKETSALRGDYCPVLLLNGASIEPHHNFVLPDLNMTPESILEMS